MVRDKNVYGMWHGQEWWVVRNVIDQWWCHLIACIDAESDYIEYSLGALFYSPVDFTDASDLHQSIQVWCIGEINRWIKQRTLCD